MEEIWKDIKGYEGLYQISNKGQVKSKARRGNWKETILKPSETRDHYFVVTLSKNGVQKSRRVNRIVAETFIENPLNKPEVNHIDGDKHNNNVENLEWVTTKENIIHSYKCKLRTAEESAKSLGIYAQKGKINQKSKTVYQFNKQGKLVAVYGSVREAERKTKISSNCISSCCLKKSKYAGNYIWRYKEMVQNEANK